jgi:hypothetical protein
MKNLITQTFTWQTTKFTIHNEYCWRSSTIFITCTKIIRMHTYLPSKNIYRINCWATKGQFDWLAIFQNSNVANINNTQSDYFKLKKIAMGILNLKNEQSKSCFKSNLKLTVKFKASWNYIANNGSQYIPDKQLYNEVNWLNFLKHILRIICLTNALPSTVHSTV